MELELVQHGANLCGQYVDGSANFGGPLGPSYRLGGTVDASHVTLKGEGSTDTFTTTS